MSNIAPAVEPEPAPSSLQELFERVADACESASRSTETVERLLATIDAELAR
jgi:hypothetical protein